MRLEHIETVLRREVEICKERFKPKKLGWGTRLMDWLMRESSQDNALTGSQVATLDALTHVVLPSMETLAEIEAEIIGFAKKTMRIGEKKAREREFIRVTTSKDPEIKSLREQKFGPLAEGAAVMGTILAISKLWASENPDDYIAGLEVYRCMAVLGELEELRIAAIPGFLREAEQWDDRKLLKETSRRKAMPSIYNFPSLELPLELSDRVDCENPTALHHHTSTRIVDELIEIAQRRGSMIHLQVLDKEERGAYVEERREIKRLMGELGESEAPRSEKPTVKKKSPEELIDEKLERITQVRAKQQEEIAKCNGDPERVRTVNKAYRKLIDEITESL